MKIFPLLVALLLSAGSVSASQVRTVPAPEGAPISKKFSLKAGDVPVSVYVTRVPGADRKRYYEEMKTPQAFAPYYSEASFASFDLKGGTKLSVTCPMKVESAKILPSSAKVIPVIQGNTVSFEVSGPSKLTLEVNGDEFESLHLFANPWEENIPKPGDPNVLYYGPGIHEVDSVWVNSGQTVYIAAGAIVRGKPDPAKPKGTLFMLSGSNINFRGRGIVDGSLCPRHTRQIITTIGSDVTIEGVILCDSSAFTCCMRKSDRVTVKNIKIFGHRGNSDGIDICNSRDVKVSDCFLRTWDDLVVVKTDKGQGTSERILVEKCVLYNEIAHALSIGAELRELVDDVLFTDCDVIHDKGREWTLRVFHCDSALIRNVRFSNIRVEESKRLISLWIGQTVWTRDSERGRIDGVVFEKIDFAGQNAKIALHGFDETHLVENVRFDQVTFGGQKLRPEQVEQNAHVRGVTIAP